MQNTFHIVYTYIIFSDTPLFFIFHAANFFAKIISEIIFVMYLKTTVISARRGTKLAALISFVLDVD